MGIVPAAFLLAFLEKCESVRQAALICGVFFSDASDTQWKSPFFLHLSVSSSGAK